MNMEELIREIKNNISLYKNFVCPDYPELNIFASQYLDVLIKYYNDAKKPYSVVYLDVNKLSIVNKLYGEEVGDKTLYTLLRIFNTHFKTNNTVRVGGDEFITFVSNADKHEIEKRIISTKVDIDRQKDRLYGSGITFALEDSSSGNVEKLIELTEKSVSEQKKDRNNDLFMDKFKSSENYTELLIPDGISEEQKEKWKILNEKINILVDNHSRDIRPASKRFEYKPEHINKDLKAFGTAFINLFYNISQNIPKEKQEEMTDSSSDNYFNMSSKVARAMHYLFKGEDVNLESFSEEELTELNNAINSLGNSVIYNKNSGLLNKSYYKIFLADKLLNSRKTYQAVCFSINGIRPSNTAYGHLVTDDKMEKTTHLLIEAFKKRRNFNNEPFTFNKKDVFFIDQGGGNFLALLPNNKKLKPEEIEEIVNEVNAKCTNEKDSSFKIAATSKDKVNKYTIPYYVNSMPESPSTIKEWFRNISLVIKNRQEGNRLLLNSGASSNDYSKKPFVQLARRLDEECSIKKDDLRVESLSQRLNQDSIEALSEDCISYFYNNIENSSSVEARKQFSDNVILALANRESYFNAENKKTLNKKLEQRKVFGKKSFSDRLFKKKINNFERDSKNRDDMEI